MNQIARELISAFQATERPEAAAVLLREEDGYDNDALRILSAWSAIEHPWKMPTEPQPDSGRPTMKAWRWMMSGLEIDHAAISDASGVSLAVTRIKLRSLIGSRLIYPDGQLAAIAKGIIAASLGKRISGKKKPKRSADSDAN